jgi:hypothetical protein
MIYRIPIILFALAALTSLSSLAAVIITCPADISQATDPGSASAIVNYPSPVPVIAGAEPSPTIVCTPASGSSFSIGLTTVNCIATDLANNTGSCSFTVNVTDNQPPVYFVPSKYSYSDWSDSIFFPYGNR